MQKSNRQSDKLSIWLMAWPFGALIVSVVMYAIVNFTLSTSAGPSQLSIVLNVLFIILAASAVAIGPLSFVVGSIILVTTRRNAARMASAHPATPAHANATATPTPKANTAATMSLVLGIIGIITSFFALGLIIGIIGVILSIIGLKRTHGKGRAVAGLATNICAIVIGSMILLMASLIAYGNSQTDTFDTKAQAYASSIAKKAEAYNAFVGGYPELADLVLSDDSLYRLTDEERSVVGGPDSDAEVLYVLCTSPGVALWHWSEPSDRYVSSYKLGDTSDC